MSVLRHKDERLFMGHPFLGLMRRVREVNSDVDDDSSAAPIAKLVPGFKYYPSTAALLKPIMRAQDRAILCEKDPEYFHRLQQYVGRDHRFKLYNLDVYEELSTARSDFTGAFQPISIPQKLKRGSIVRQRYLEEVEAGQEKFHREFTESLRQPEWTTDPRKQKKARKVDEELEAVRRAAEASLAAGRPSEPVTRSMADELDRESKGVVDTLQFLGIHKTPLIEAAKDGRPERREPLPVPDIAVYRDQYRTDREYQIALEISHLTRTIAQRKSLANERRLGSAMSPQQSALKGQLDEVQARLARLHRIKKAETEGDLYNYLQSDWPDHADEWWSAVSELAQKDRLEVLEETDEDPTLVLQPDEIAEQRVMYNEYVYTWRQQRTLAENMDPRKNPSMLDEPAPAILSEEMPESWQFWMERYLAHKQLTNPEVFGDDDHPLAWLEQRRAVHLDNILDQCEETLEAEQERLVDLLEKNIDRVDDQLETERATLDTEVQLEDLKRLRERLTGLTGAAAAQEVARLAEIEASDAKEQAIRSLLSAIDAESTGSTPEAYTDLDQQLQATLKERCRLEWQAEQTGDKIPNTGDVFFAPLKAQWRAEFARAAAGQPEKDSHELMSPASIAAAAHLARAVLSPASAKKSAATADQSADLQQRWATVTAAIQADLVRPANESTEARRARIQRLTASRLALVDLRVELRAVFARATRSAVPAKADIEAARRSASDVELLLDAGKLDAAQEVAAQLEREFEATLDTFANWSGRLDTIFDPRGGNKHRVERAAEIASQPIAQLHARVHEMMKSPEERQLDQRLRALTVRQHRALADLAQQMKLQEDGRATLIVDALISMGVVRPTAGDELPHHNFAVNQLESRRRELARTSAARAAEMVRSYEEAATLEAKQQILIDLLQAEDEYWTSVRRTSGKRERYLRAAVRNWFQTRATVAAAEAAKFDREFFETIDEVDATSAELENLFWETRIHRTRLEDVTVNHLVDPTLRRDAERMIARAAVALAQAQGGDKVARQAELDAAKQSLFDLEHQEIDLESLNQQNQPPQQSQPLQQVVSAEYGVKETILKIDPTAKKAKDDQGESAEETQSYSSHEQSPAHLRRLLVEVKRRFAEMTPLQYLQWQIATLEVRIARRNASSTLAEVWQRQVAVESVLRAEKEADAKLLRGIAAGNEKPTLEEIELLFHRAKLSGRYDMDFLPEDMHNVLANTSNACASVLEPIEHADDAQFQFLSSRLEEVEGEIAVCRSLDYENNSALNKALVALETSKKRFDAAIKQRRKEIEAAKESEEGITRATRVSVQPTTDEQRAAARKIADAIAGTPEPTAVAVHDQGAEFNLASAALASESLQGLQADASLDAAATFSTSESTIDGLYELYIARLREEDEAARLAATKLVSEPFVPPSEPNWLEFSDAEVEEEKKEYARLVARLRRQHKDAEVEMVDRATDRLIATAPARNPAKLRSEFVQRAATEAVRARLQSAGDSPTEIQSVLDAIDAVDSASTEELEARIASLEAESQQIVSSRYRWLVPNDPTQDFDLADRLQVERRLAREAAEQAKIDAKERKAEVGLFVFEEDTRTPLTRDTVSPDWRLEPDDDLMQDAEYKARPIDETELRIAREINAARDLEENSTPLSAEELYAIKQTEEQDLAMGVIPNIHPAAGEAPQPDFTHAPKNADTHFPISIAAAMAKPLTAHAIVGIDISEMILEGTGVEGDIIQVDETVQMAVSKILEQSVQRFPHATYIITYPIFGRGYQDQLLQSIMKTGVRNIIQGTYHIQKGEPFDSAGRVYDFEPWGAGVAVIRPPPGFEKTLKDIINTMHEVMVAYGPSIHTTEEEDAVAQRIFPPSDKQISSTFFVDQSIHYEKGWPNRPDVSWMTEQVDDHIKNVNSFKWEHFVPAYEGPRSKRFELLARARSDLESDLWNYSRGYRGDDEEANRWLRLFGNMGEQTKTKFKLKEPVNPSLQRNGDRPKAAERPWEAQSDHDSTGAAANAALNATPEFELDPLNRHTVSQESLAVPSVDYGIVRAQNRAIARLREGELAWQRDLKRTHVFDMLATFQRGKIEQARALEAEAKAEADRIAKAKRDGTYVETAEETVRSARRTTERTRNLSTAAQIQADEQYQAMLEQHGQQNESFMIQQSLLQQQIQARAAAKEGDQQ